jgi:hypothetical protein
MIFLKLSIFNELWFLWSREENFGRIFCKSIKALFLIVFCVEDSNHFLVLQEPRVHKL